MILHTIVHDNKKGYVLRHVSFFLLKILLKPAGYWGILYVTSISEVIHTIEITKDTIIGDILDVAPQTAPIFLSIGMHCLGCPSSRGETVEEACAVHGIDVDKLLAVVNEEANKPIAE